MGGARVEVGRRLLDCSFQTRLSCFTTSLRNLFKLIKANVWVTVGAVLYARFDDGQQQSKCLEAVVN